MTVSYLHKEKVYSCMYTHRLKEKFKINNQWFKRNTNEIKQKQRKQRLRRGNTTKRNKRKKQDKNKTV